MIDKQKIQQAANNYIGHEPEIDEGCNVSARREAFKDGVDWFKMNNQRLHRTRFIKAIRTFVWVRWPAYSFFL